ncbi:hypothetical protein ABIC63_000555 [Pseudacidovorax sp. 1753]
MNDAARPPTWDAADSAYQRHHFTCATCCAAGASQGADARCPAGQTLWGAYQSAGMPPHFLWIREHR